MANHISKTATIGNKQIKIETGEMAKQADGAVLFHIGDTIVLVAVVASSKAREGIDFFPLTVDYREKTYAAGRIPGGFFKREMRARDNEILTSRLIDRTIRPLFPEGMVNDVQVWAHVVSSDLENDPDIAAINGTAMALAVSPIAFKGPVAAVRVGRVEGNWIINPTIQEQEESDIDLIVSGTPSAIMMVEGGACQVPEADILEAFRLAHEEIKVLCALQVEMAAAVGAIKGPYVSMPTSEEITKEVESLTRDTLAKAVREADRMKRQDLESLAHQKAEEALIAKFPGQEQVISNAVTEVMYQEARQLVLKERKRSDGRGFTDIRPLSSRTSVLPRTHGSALFTRGQTQALVTATLGTPSDMQIMDELEGEYKEHFMLHYNFPGFSTGEAKPDRGPGRREIGHGALAKRAIYPLLPDEESFPYTIRVVSEILESNGSSSMASVTGASLSLFDAGVPLQAACAGIAMGLMKEGDSYAILTDIQGLEDHLGDMDFKVAGTRTGVTAIQMDLKIQGISLDLMREAVEQARVARLHILDHMEKTLAEPKAQLSAYAPRMITVQIPVEKIGALIGPGGKNIKSIIETTGAEVEVEDDGRVYISSMDSRAVDAARRLVEGVTAVAEMGKIYTGKVTRVMGIGVFVEIMPGKEGLVRMNQLDTKFVEKAEDLFKEGDEIQVKVIEVDPQGRVNLSRKAVLAPGSEFEGRGGDRPGGSGGGYRGGDRGASRGRSH